MSYSEYSKCPSLARMQLWRRLRYWSMVSQWRFFAFQPPNINQTLPQIVHILHFCLVDSLLHYATDLYSTAQKSGLLCGHKSGELFAGVSRSKRLIVLSSLCARHWHAKRLRTRQRPDVWQAAHHDNMLYWPWLQDRRISNWWRSTFDKPTDTISD